MDTVSCVIEAGVATIQIDDGKSNALSPKVFQQLNRAFDDAERAGAIVVLRGREDIFSAGFDLNVLKYEVKGAYVMLIEGFKLARRLLAFPRPVIIVSEGHAIAMGVFLVLCADYRIGLEGSDYRYVANEVEIGLAMPFSAIEICRQRLGAPIFHRAVNLSESFSPDQAVGAGFLDVAVEKQDLDIVLKTTIERFSALDSMAHRSTKLRARKKSLRAIGRTLVKDRLNFVKIGVSRAMAS